MGLCKKAKCEDEPFGWEQGHKDFGFCLNHGVDRWYKRFVKRCAVKLVEQTFEARRTGRAN